MYPRNGAGGFTDWLMDHEGEFTLQVSEETGPGVVRAGLTGPGTAAEDRR
jgi:hypothetical protein